MGAEFLAMILVVVYVGAVAVLFLFVVMMLDINFVELRQGLPAISADRCAGRVGAVGRVGPDPGHLGHRARCQEAGAAATAMAITVTQHRGARPGALHRLHLSVPGGGHDPAGCDDRRDRADAASREGVKVSASPTRSRAPEESCRRSAVTSNRGGGLRAMEIGLSHYLTVAAILFTLGVFGIFLNRKNVIVILMSIELMLLAVNINLVAFSAICNDLQARCSRCSS